MSVEEPPFQIVLQDGPFSIRAYPTLVVAEVTVTGDQRTAADHGFRLLAGYIFGGNAQTQNIAMTAPVSQTPAGETIAMTAPVGQTRIAGGWVVRFTMPRGTTLASLPVPRDPKIRLRATPPTRFAVIRFSGVAMPEAVAAKTADLRAWMQRRRLREAGPPTLAQYNPPWTLWFLRRNEVMIPLPA